MYPKETLYVAHTVDENGIANYSAEENTTWNKLYIRQLPLVQKNACPEYIEGLKLLNLPEDRVPQCPDVSAALKKATGWSLEPVPALIPFDRFFNLLATQRFPAATFIRRPEELNYVKEPDIFHEIFGHCPLLTNPAYAAFVHTYGKLSLNASREDRVLLARLYWFTIEFGLIKSASGIRAYGGGILSSINETQYSVESDLPLRKKLNVLEALRTPYRIDKMQPIYFVIENFSDLFQLIDMDLIGLIQEARRLGEFPMSTNFKD